MPKKRKPLVTPKQLRSQKPKKNGGSKSGSGKTKRVSTGLSMPSPKPPKIKVPKTQTQTNKSSANKSSTNSPKPSTVLDIDTGELTQVKQPIVNEEANFYSDVIINSWLRALEQFSNGSAYNFLKNWLDDMIAQNGRDNVADMLQEGASNGCILTWEVVYKQGEAERYVSTMLNYLPDQGELYKEDIKDKFEYYRQMTDAMEQDEDWEQPE